MADTPQTPKQLVDSRQPTYGDSWQWVHVALLALPIEVQQRLISSRFFHPWYMIIAKLMRLAVDPFHLDSWKDIQGYAQLVIDQLDSKGGE